RRQRLLEVAPRSAAHAGQRRRAEARRNDAQICGVVESDLQPNGTRGGCFLAHHTMSSNESFIAMPRPRHDDEVDAQDRSTLPDVSARCSAFLLDYILTLFPLAVTLVLAFYMKRRLLEPTVGDFFQYVGYALVLAVIFVNWVYGYVRHGQSFGKRF